MSKSRNLEISNFKYQIACLLFVILCLPISAHNSLIGIGVRGGGQMYLPSAAAGSTAKIQGAIGGVGGLDLRYTFYGCFTDRIGMGFVVAAGVGYGSTGLKGTNTDQYTNYDYLNNRMDYTVDSKFHQTTKGVQADASLLLAFCFGNFTVNLGPRFMMPFSSSSTLTIDEAHINAYFPKYDVTVTDKPITGALTTPDIQSVSSILPTYSVLMGLELGYDWYITDKTCFGIQLFADVSVWSPQSPITNHQSPIIAVGKISDAMNPAPSVSVNTLDGQIGGLRYLDFGLRAFVAFSVAKDRGYKSRIHPHRDTRKHRNRYLWW